MTAATKTEAKPYACPRCGAKFSTHYVRCIGTDGTHVPTVPIYLAKRFQP